MTIEEKDGELAESRFANPLKVCRLVWQQPVHVQFTRDGAGGYIAAGIVAPRPDVHLAIGDGWHCKFHRISGSIPGSL
jgi:hypothetical protein